MGVPPPAEAAKKVRPKGDSTQFLPNGAAWPMPFPGHRRSPMRSFSLAFFFPSFLFFLFSYFLFSFLFFLLLLFFFCLCWGGARASPSLSLMEYLFLDPSILSCTIQCPYPLFFRAPLLPPSCTHTLTLTLSSLIVPSSTLFSLLHGV